MARYKWVDGDWVCFDKGPGRGAPDVYFKGQYTDHNLSNWEHPGAKVISSRSEKKYWLEKCNLREAGDRVHGGTSFDPISNRHATESLRRTKQ